MNTEKIAIHEAKNSEKVVKFIDATVESLAAYCSKAMAVKIMKAYNNGDLWGCYFTKSGSIKAEFKG